MNKTVLITGKDTVLGSELCDQALSAGWQVAATVNPKNEDIEVENPHLLILPWNRRSSVSTKSIVLKTLNKWGGIDEAFLPFSVHPTEQPLPEIPLYFIEEKIDFSIKGTLYLTRELLSYFERKKNGQVKFILEKDLDQLQNPMEAVEVGAFKAFAESILSEYNDSPIEIAAYLTRSPNLEDFSRYLLMETGKRSKNKSLWNTFQEKTSLFGNFRKN